MCVIEYTTVGPYCNSAMIIDFGRSPQPVRIGQMCVSSKGFATADDVPPFRVRQVNAHLGMDPGAGNHGPGSLDPDIDPSAVEIYFKPHDEGPGTMACR